MIHLLERLLEPRDIRAAISRLTQDSRGRSIEWIVAAAEHDTTPRKTLKLPDESLATLLVELAGADLLADRELRQLIALRSDPRMLERLHDYPSTTRGTGGARSLATAVAQRKWHPGKACATHFVRVT